LRVARRLPATRRHPVPVAGGLAALGLAVLVAGVTAPMAVATVLAAAVVALASLLLQRPGLAGRTTRWALASLLGIGTACVLGLPTLALLVPAFGDPGLFVGFVSFALVSLVAVLAVGARNPPPDPVAARRVFVVVAAFTVGAAAVGWPGRPPNDSKGLFVLLAVEVALLLAGLYVMAVARGWPCRRTTVGAVSAFTLVLLLTWASALGHRVHQLGLQRLEDVRKEVQLLEVVANKLEEFKQDVLEVETAAESARVLLPAKLDVAAFGEELRAWAEEAGVRILASYFETSPRGRAEGRQGDPWEAATITYFLAGKTDALEDLVRYRDGPARLAMWKEPKATATGVEVSVEVYALPDPAEKPAKGVCDGIDAFWTPVIQQSLQSGHSRLDQLQVVQRQVSALEAGRLHLRRREEAIERIRRRREETARLSD